MGLEGLEVIFYADIEAERLSGADELHLDIFVTSICEDLFNVQAGCYRVVGTDQEPIAVDAVFKVASEQQGSEIRLMRRALVEDRGIDNGDTALLAIDFDNSVAAFVGHVTETHLIVGSAISEEVAKNFIPSLK